MIARPLFQQIEEDFELNVFQTAEDELASTVRRLKIQLDSGIDSFEKFGDKIQGSIEESLKSTTINYQEYLNKALENFSTNSQEILKNFKETADEQFKLKEKFQSLNNELTNVCKFVANILSLNT